MKTLIKSLFATGLIALVMLTSVAYANVADISSIQKIIVTGNVQVTIVQSPKSKILYENENDVNVLVKKTNNSLTIDGSNSINTAEITIYVDNIYRIEASGNAIVQTKGTFNLKDLQIFVKDRAKVDVNAQIESLYTAIKNSAELKLQGHANFHVLTMDKLSKITLENFSAIKTEKNNTDITAYAAIKN